ncbi:MAG: anthranilate phosphoribosyltransferase [Gammaproteobacteria bacterium 28-57-27]|nr:MAG: anthranilate phosphoribosyltransferase [Gammaproteobacteria bacterium 28-57-27]
MNLTVALRALLERRDLTHAEMTEVMRALMSGEATSAQVGGLLMGLGVKGETVEEVAAAASVMREFAAKVEIPCAPLVDIVGTGGDGAHTFNISTASCFVLAAAGGKVAKHGSRSMSSVSGSADLLEAAGCRLDVPFERIAQAVCELGVGFMFAPQHHSAMRHVNASRRELGVRTMFNVLGPLSNPAGAKRQVLGVFSERWRRPLAEVLLQLGSEHALVIHADDGLDEFSIAAPTQVSELKDGIISDYSLRPEDVGLFSASLDSLRVASPQESLLKVQEALSGQPGAARDIVAFNAGAAIYLAGLASTLREGVARALEIQTSGAAWDTLQAYVAFTQQVDV